MKVPQGPAATGNAILDRLSADDLKPLLAFARHVRFGHQEEVYRAGSVAAPVYFPVSGVYSLQLPMMDGLTVEVGVVDSEGLVGIPAVLGLDRTPLRAVAQVPGECISIPPARFVAELQKCGPLDHLIRRFLAVSWHTANQNVACSLRHSVRQRVCRWLLGFNDRTKTSEFELTHETLAMLVGASRQKITAVAGRLQSEGLIRYHRGRVRITHRAGLETASCECYRVLRNAYEILTA